MTWVKLDDQLPSHPKLVTAGYKAGWLFVCGLCYCGQYLTDGVIPKAFVHRLTDLPDPKAAADRLVEVGLWVSNGNSYEIPGFLDHNQSKAQVEKDRASARERKRRKASGQGSAEVRTNSKRTPAEVRQPDTDTDTDRSFGRTVDCDKSTARTGRSGADWSDPEMIQ